MGALSIPISTLWEVAAALMRPGTDSVRRVAQVISDLARKYEESVRLAMGNQYLWRNAAAPGDVGSFDIAALTISAFRAFTPTAMQETLEKLGDAASPLARSQIEIAIEMAREAYGEPGPPLREPVRIR